MARNKHPEETIQLILDVAKRLFIEKGYDETSIQDIINETKLSKGAIYHHFASKEAIFTQICERIGQEHSKMLEQIRDDASLSGHEKLKVLFRFSLLSELQESVLSMVPYLLDSPKFLVMEIKGIFAEVVPDFITPILEEGIADGTIRAKHPKELAEALMILADVWINPLLQPTTAEEVRARCDTFSQLTKSFGICLLDEELTEAVVRLCNILENRRKDK